MGVTCERIRSGLAWLAVFLTPVTGIPHFVCSCPNGHVKPFCLGWASKATGCCCGRACCRRSSDGKRCCCCSRGVPTAQRPSAKPSPDGHCSVGRPGCSKTLAGQEALAPSAGKRIAWNDLLCGVGLPASNVPRTPLANGMRGNSSSYNHAPAPPADLIALLGRLLI